MTDHIRRTGIVIANGNTTSHDPRPIGAVLNNLLPAAV